METQTFANASSSLKQPTVEQCDCGKHPCICDVTLEAERASVRRRIAEVRVYAQDATARCEFCDEVGGPVCGDCRDWAGAAGAEVAALRAEEVARGNLV